jgi:hypothetical protein
MSTRIQRTRLIEILENDEEIVARLVEEGLIIEEAQGFSQRDIERALVARTLVRELEVNWAGVEVILLMRDQMRATQRQVADMLAALREATERE